MNLLNNIAKRVANELVKAPNFPVGSVTMSESQMLRSSITQTQPVPQVAPMPRSQTDASVPFGPAIPILPAAINPANINTGRPDPRRYEYQVAQNINVTETRPVPFKTLRMAADQIDILRRCVEVLKAKVIGLDWDITLGEDAAERIVSEIGGNRSKAMVQARENFNADIARLRAFWETPDKSNGLIFADWLNIALEEILVLDAWAIWPQTSVGGDLLGLQILDGSTIKPLIDDRGMRPVPPNPAFQQILYGFPRSEFTSPTETENTDGEFTSDELSYLVKNRRTNTVYGYSPVERALPLSDIYLRRQQWLRAEYTDGVTPELLMKTDANFGNNPDLLRAYENIFNDDLAGQTEQRKRVRLLPTGMEPIQFDGYGERFKDTLDTYLVHSICGHFGVLPSEIGFTPAGGLGGAGHQSGEAQSGEVIGSGPLANWVAKMITNLSYVYLGMPRELEFKFMPSARQDGEALARTRDIELKNGAITLNELRSEAGRSLIESPEADMPIMIAGMNAYFITADGAIPFDSNSATTEISTTQEISTTEEVTDAVEVPETMDNEDTAKKAQDEIKRFVRWLKKSPTRPFNFEDVPLVYAEVLNKFVSVKDYDSALWYAERYLA